MRKLTQRLWALIRRLWDTVGGNALWDAIRGAAQWVWVRKQSALGWGMLGAAAVTTWEALKSPFGPMLIVVFLGTFVSVFLILAVVIPLAWEEEPEPERRVEQER